MTLRDDLLKDIDDARQMVDDFGFRRAGVAVETVVYSAPINTPGAAVVSTTRVEITPRPRVTQLSAEASAIVMATIPAAVSARGYRLVYEVTAITPQFETGGYTLNELVQPAVASPSVVIDLLIWGIDGFGSSISDATRFDILRVIEKAFRYTFYVGMVGT